MYLSNIMSLGCSPGAQKQTDEQKSSKVPVDIYQVNTCNAFVLNRAPGKCRDNRLCVKETTQKTKKFKGQN